MEHYRDEQWPKVAIIVLNWNGWKDTLECLESLSQIVYPNYNVIVVDNGSDDESTEKIIEYCEGMLRIESNMFEYNPDNTPIKIIEYTREEVEEGGGKEGEISGLPSNRKLILIKNKQNYGFSEGNNVGIVYGLNTLNSDYILLLNNDTVVDIEFLNVLIEAGEKKGNIGLICPLIYYYSDPQKIQYSGREWDWYGLGLFKNLIEYNDRFKEQKTLDGNIIETQFAIGACMLIKRETIKEVGLLSTEYFLECEDTDYSLRLKEKDIKIACAIKSRIWHKGSASLNKISRNFIRYYTRNRFVVRAKYGTKIQMVFFIVISFIQGFIYSIYWLIRFKDIQRVYGLIDGFREGLAFVARYMRQS